jgi:hypothetical protein
MHRPTALAPASRLVALGEHLIAALRYTELSPDLIAPVLAATAAVRHASNLSDVALRAVVPARVAYRFAEALLVGETRVLAREAAKLKIFVDERESMPAAALATELLARLATHPNGAGVLARHEASVRSALELLETKSAEHDAALAQHEDVAKLESPARERFVRLYAECIAKVESQIADPALVAAFFDDPCARRAMRRPPIPAEPVSGEHTIDARVAA